MAGTNPVAVNSSSYTSLGTGPMIISPELPIMVVFSASQPAATVVGHPLSFMYQPFYSPLSEQAWAIARNGSGNVIVST